MRLRFRNEDGATAVVVAVLLLVLIGMLALAVDGGLIWAKGRSVRNANDSAALAAAISCATGEGLATANVQADDLAVRNASDATQITTNSYPDGCDIQGGTVRVNYGGTQELMFGPAIGVGSPHPVQARATALWGAALGTGDMIPVVLMRDRLSSCRIIPDQGTFPVAGTTCSFWWDNDLMGDATWGFLNLASWPDTPEENVPSTTGCSGAGGFNEIGDAILVGLDEPLILVKPPPTYVCAQNGNYGQAFNNAIDAALAAGRTEFAFPINDPNLMVTTQSGNCGGGGGGRGGGGGGGQCQQTPYRYAIVGWAFLTVLGVYSPQDAEWNTHCTMFQRTANARCLLAQWNRFSTEGLFPDPTQTNFGLSAVALTE
jgi:Flp pilus assembly protein TadG